MWFADVCRWVAGSAKGPGNITTANISCYVALCGDDRGWKPLPQVAGGSRSHTGAYWKSLPQAAASRYPPPTTHYPQPTTHQLQSQLNRRSLTCEEDFQAIVVAVGAVALREFVQLRIGALGIVVEQGQPFDLVAAGEVDGMLDG